MKNVLILLIGMCLSGCIAPINLGKLEIPDFNKSDPLLLSTYATSGNNKSLKLNKDDEVAFSRMHDLAITNCLFFRNVQNELFTIGSIGVTDGDLAIAAIPAIIALTGASAGSTALAGGISAIFNNQLKGLIGLPTPTADYSTTITGFDYIYNMYITSPGIASLMNGNASERALALKEYRIALQQICISRLAMPTNTLSVYTPIISTTTTTSNQK